MIGFSCPRCKAFLTKEDKDAGVKFPCPSCGQRLQVPGPSAVNKTVLGEVLPPNPTVLADVEPAGLPPPTGTVPPSVQVTVAAPSLVPIGGCPSCRRSLSVPADQLRQWVTCPYCRVGFVALAEGHTLRRRPTPPRGPAGLPPEGPCPECGSTEPPYPVSQMSQTGLVVMIVLILFFFPLFWIGLLMKEEYWVCPGCGHRSGVRNTGPF